MENPKRRNLTRGLVLAIVLLIVATASTAFWLSLRSTSSAKSFSGQTATANGDFGMARPFSEPPAGIVVTPFRNPQNGANSRFYVTIENTRNVTLTGASATVINGSFTFCTISSCSGMTTADLCAGSNSTCSLGYGDYSILTADGRGAVVGDDYVIKLSAVYADGYKSSFNTIVQVRSQT